MSYGKDDLVGEWSKEKLQYLESYLSAFTKATIKARNKYYIDGFAGKGNWTVRGSLESLKGSARLALESNPSFSKCFFIEKDIDRALALKKIAEEYPVRKSEVLCGDCNEKIKDVLNQIHPNAPTFVFLDPSGAHLKWNTIELLAKWKTELFINFPLFMDLQRNLPNNPSKLQQWQIEKLNNVFGGTHWSDIYERKFKVEGPRFSSFSLMEIYISGLQEIGYPFVMKSDVIKNSNGANLYFLIWVGKKHVGEKIMKHVLMKQFKKQMTIDDLANI